MKKIFGTSVLALAYVLKHPSKWLLLIVVFPMSLTGGQLPVFVNDVYPYIWPMILGVKSGEVSFEFALMMLSYIWLFTFVLLHISRNAFLLSVRLYNKHGIVVPT